MKMILQHWNFIRFTRLVLGLGILIQGILYKDPLRIILGLLFGGMAVANIGCCGNSSCSINSISYKKVIEDKDHLQ